MRGISQKTRRYKLGIKDVNDYVKRYDSECGEVKTRIATEEEVKTIVSRLNLNNRRKIDDRNKNNTKQGFGY